MDETQFAVTQPKKNVLSKIPYFILLVMVFLVPIFFVPVASISIQFGTSLLFAFCVIVSVIVYIISGLMSGSLDLPKPSKYIIGFTAIVPIVYTLAGISNGFSRMAFFGYTFDISTVGFILLGFAYLFLVSLIFREKTAVFYSYFAFVLSSILLSLFILVRIIFGADVMSFGLFTNLTATPVGSWNNIGIFFGICAMLSLLTFQMVNTSKFMKAVLTVALLFSLFILVLVNFSVIWIILAISAFLFILYSMFSFQNDDLTPVSFSLRLRKVPVYPVLVFIISVVFVLFSGAVINKETKMQFGSYLPAKLGVLNTEVRPDFETTMGIAKNTILLKPLFGSGPNTFVNQWLAYRPDEVVSDVLWNVDFTNGIGLIPTFAVTTGIVGVLSWLLFLGYYVFLGVKSIFTRIGDPFVRYLLTSSFFVSLYLWIMTFVYVPSTVVFIMTFFFTGLFFASVHLAGIIKIETKMFSLNPRAGFVSSLIFVICFVASVSLGWGLWKNSESLWYFQKSSYAINTLGDIGASENHMLKAIEAVPNDIYFRALVQIEVLKLNAIVSQDPKKVKPEEIQKQFSDTLTNAIKSGMAATDVDKSNYLNWISLGQVYEAVSNPALKIEGAYESAQFSYREALARNPKNPAILVLLSRSALTKGDLKVAKDYALQSITQKRNYLDAYFLLSQIEVASNNIRGAIDSVVAATVIDPTNPAIFFQLGLLKYNIQDFKGAIEALEKATTMTPDYANAKYFLGLSYEATGKHAEAIKQFEDLRKTNPDSKEVEAILTNLLAGNPIFKNAEDSTPENGKKLPVKEKVQ